MDVKRCRKCNEAKPIEMFAGNGRQKDGLHHTCKRCIGTTYEARRKRRPLGSDVEHIDQKTSVAASVQQTNILNIKRCAKCKITMLTEMFSENIKQKDGLHHTCKSCMQAHQETLEVNAEKRRQAKEATERERQADVLAYRQAKREYRELIQATIKSNAEKRRQAKHISGSNKQAQYQRRKAWIIANGGSHTQEEVKALLEAQNHQCAYCKRHVPLTEDHIIPVSKGGNDYISNICMACDRCNYQKRDRTPEQWIKRWYLQESSDQND
jgi:5-methylcytosine-specific restriction endonuclease McrA